MGRLLNLLLLTTLFNNIKELYEVVIYDFMSYKLMCNRNLMQAFMTDRSVCLIYRQNPPPCPGLS